MSKDAPYHNQVVEGLFSAEKELSQLINKGHKLVTFSVRITGDFDWRLASQQAEEIIRESPDAVIPVGALCAQVTARVFAQKNIKIPVVSAGVANPDGIGMTEYIKEYDLPFTGVSLGFPDYLMTAKVLLLIKPQVKSLLLPYSTVAEGGALASAAQLIKVFFEQRNIEVITRPFSPGENPVDLVKQKITHCDSLMILEGCFLTHYHEQLIPLCRKYGVTCFASLVHALRLGAAAGVIENPGIVSTHVFEQIGSILMQKQDARNLPFIFLGNRGRRLGLNLSACREQGIFFAKDFLSLLECSVVTGAVSKE